MSRDNVTCIKCEKPCGYDDRKVIWADWRGNSYICGQCKDNIVSRFCAFFGIDGVSSDEYGLDIEWNYVDKILSNIKRDDAMRISYITSDKELYERTKTLPVSILNP